MKNHYSGKSHMLPVKICIWFVVLVWFGFMLISPNEIHLYKIQFSALSKSSKLSWLYQDIKQLSYNIFNVPLTILELKRTISEAEEIQMLNRFNDIVEEISQRENINPTLFFSKKSQKDFLRTLYLQGLTSAYQGITEWRVQLIKEDILNLIK